VKSYVFTLTRTRIQSCDVTVQARTAHEDEGQLDYDMDLQTALAADREGDQ
jgi:hypothetical protein